VTVQIYEQLEKTNPNLLISATLKESHMDPSMTLLGFVEM